MVLRSLVVGMVLSSGLSFAQTEWAPLPPPAPAPGPGPVPTPMPTPVRPLPSPTDPLKLGVQFHGDFQGILSGTGTGSLGVNVSVGLGLNRVAFLLSPGFSLFSNTVAFSLGLSARIYLANRQAGVLVGFLRPSAMLGVVSGGSVGVGFGGLGFGGGGEYLLTRNLGITAELGLVFNSLGLSGGFGTTALAAFTTVGSVGVMLHN